MIRKLLKLLKLRWKQRRVACALRTVAQALNYCKANHGLGLIVIEDRDMQVICEKITLYAKL